MGNISSFYFLCIQATRKMDLGIHAHKLREVEMTQL